MDKSSTDKLHAHITHIRFAYFNLSDCAEHQHNFLFPQSFQRENKKLDADNSVMLEHIEKLQIEIQQQTPSNVSSNSQYSAMKNISNYTAEDVIQLLREIKLEKYMEDFKQNFIDGTLLVTLTEDELCEEIGLRRIEAKRLLIEIGRRQKLISK